MGKGRLDLVIIDRGFWPQGQVLGEALLQFAEKAAEEHSVCVVTQTSDDLRMQMDSAGRGKDVELLTCKAYTDSSSSLIRRAAEAVLFMSWTLFCLIKVRPGRVYVSTNPPVVVPFIVALYCRLFGANYYYHLQDIHPEAANIVVPLHPALSKMLGWLDNFTLRHAASLITLSDDMRHCLISRSTTSRPVHLLDNPFFPMEPKNHARRTGDVVYCGNAGRLQRIPLVISAIKQYMRKGGKLNFTFAGGGIFAPEVKALADAHERVNYLGVISAADASDLVSQHRWALLPIEDEVTRYAFPSKSSAYVLSGCGILAVCGSHTSVARWVAEHEVGIVCEPELDALVECFSSLEQQDSIIFNAKEGLRNRLGIGFFVKRLNEIVFT